MEKSIGVALIGFGTVGSSVYTLLDERSEEFANRFGKRFEVRSVMVRDPKKKRKVPLPEELLAYNFDDVLDDIEVKVIIEVMGGVDPAYKYIRKALKADRHIVTANKHLLAEKGDKLEATALNRGVTMRYEAAVGGIVPIFTALGGGVHALKVERIRGILNGTCNFILSAMYNEGIPYNEALGMAQDGGLAEMDPTLDISGLDTAHKLCVLSRLAFGTFLPLKRVKVEGIGPEMKPTVDGSKHQGLKTKLIGTLSMEGKDGDDLPDADVGPVGIGQGDPLYRYDGTMNCVVLDTGETGIISTCGRGAGGKETATAVISDLISIAVARDL